MGPTLVFFSCVDSGLPVLLEPDVDTVDVGLLPEVELGESVDGGGAVYT